MSELEGDWITKRVDAAQQSSPVNGAIVSEVIGQLRGTMRERPLRPAELATLAKELLAAPADPDAGRHRRED